MLSGVVLGISCIALKQKSTTSFYHTVKLWFKEIFKGVYINCSIAFSGTVPFVSSSHVLHTKQPFVWQEITISCLLPDFLLGEITLIHSLVVNICTFLKPEYNLKQLWPSFISI